MPTGFDFGEYMDDESVPDDAILYRRVPPDIIIWDENRNDYRAASIALTDGADDDPMSVYLRSALDQRRLGPADTLLLPQQLGYWVLALPAHAVRDQGQRIVRDAIEVEEPCGFAHALVVGSKNGKRRKRMNNRAEWAFRGPNPPKRPRPDLRSAPG